jgi:hypothetical protein
MPAAGIGVRECGRGGGQRSGVDAVQFGIDGRPERIGQVDGQDRAASRRRAAPASAPVVRPLSMAIVPFTNT